ncbi:hypothetical protein KNP414_00924 [Paenibacillus mucilaginosus KNP414]|uniref:Uncharacterized protein n=1 Tax=Paenibacillus mucilaginosus (strain KNP414) TaxID=1036673 RepID=F8F7M9_PAEMK|nr:hypothetical protein KNP414_00924 [Paenibacillus mucilaginosus KNP414]
MTTQLTPEEDSPYWAAMLGVETLKTVSFKTPKNMMKIIQGAVRRTSRDTPEADAGAAGDCMITLSFLAISE